MCINVEELNKNVVTIKNYKSIKKKADEKLKPLEQTVKDFMDETGQTKYIGYGYSISYKEMERETAIKEKVLEFLNIPQIRAVVDTEGIDTSVLFKTTVVRPLRIS
ncbi:hypothetical protein D7V82_20905 [bacterium 1xD8-6]|nr:hypothetical protein D7V72_14690 [bacterium D16-36]RKI63179.1 hypothetical protein D7V82_20905 [bacterium 1xD8-6]